MGLEGLEALIDPEGDYVWRAGRYEYVRRPVPAFGGIGAENPWWQDPEYLRVADLLQGADEAEAARLFVDCWSLIDRMRAKS